MMLPKSLVRKSLYSLMPYWRQGHALLVEDLCFVIFEVGGFATSAIMVAVVRMRHSETS